MWATINRSYLRGIQSCLPMVLIPMGLYSLPSLMSPRSSCAYSAVLVLEGNLERNPSLDEGSWK